MLKLIVLAVLQGIAEFLPISSSGHLVIAKSILHISEADATVEIFLHFGTLIAILAFYRRKIFELIRPVFGLRFRDDSVKFVFLVLLASVPAGVVGVAWKDELESLFSRSSLASAMLLLTALVLFATYLSRRREGFRWNVFSSLAVGFAQALAILPGLSRSGFTIAVALLLGAAPESAAEFSFILAIPALAGAMTLKTAEIITQERHISPQLILATIISATIGYIALSALIPVLKRGKFWMFGIYCAALGIVGLIIM